MNYFEMGDLKEIIVIVVVFLLGLYILFIMQGCIGETNVRYKMELQHKIDNNLILPDKPLEIRGGMR